VAGFLASRGIALPRGDPADPRAGKRYAAWATPRTGTSSPTSAEGDTTNRYKASKQTDVLMLFYLLSAEELRGLLDRLGYRLAPDAIRRNVNYDLEHTSHGSTLSGVVNAWVLARSDRPRSWWFLVEALASDVHDVQGGTTAEGIHLAAMAGTVHLAQRCYTGLETREDVPWLNPSLPEELDGLDFDVRYRGHRGINLHLTPRLLKVRVADSDAAPIKVGVKGEVFELPPGSMRDFPLEPAEPSYSV
jgi:trehalose/maltose hydrolase-like predicted phosphorylase